MMVDLVFVGGGPAGYEGAIAAAKKGLKAAVVEADKLGGTCLQRGCIPTKAMLHSVKAIKHFRQLGKLGIEAGEYKVNYAEMVKRRERIVSKNTKGIEFLFKKYGIELINGRGRLAAPGKVALADGGQIEARHVCLATGSRAADLPFLKRDGRIVLNSDDLLDLKDIPRSLLVVGAGAVGLEWALIFAYLGSQVTVAEIMDQVLPGTDREIADILQNELQKQGLRITTATSISAPRLGDGICLTCKQGEKSWEERADKVLLAVGRLPESRDIADPHSGLTVDGKGFVAVDGNLRTSIPGVFACGDLVGPPLLAHKAAHQAVAVVDFIAGGQAVGHQSVPAAVFTFPEVATVGFSEREARERLGKVVVGRFPYAAGSRANTMDEKSGLVKVIATETGVIVGGHIVGADAGELLPLLTYAVQHQLTAMAFKELILIHPTLGENVWEAIGEVAGFSIHL